MASVNAANGSCGSVVSGGYKEKDNKKKTKTGFPQLVRNREIDIIDRDQSLLYIPLTTLKEFTELNGRGAFRGNHE